MATTLKLSNKGKPTPPFWKGVGKVLVWSMGVVSATIVALPIPSLLVKGAIVLGANLLLALGKELTTMTFDPTKVPLTYTPQPETAQPPATKDVSKEVAEIEETKLQEEAQLVIDNSSPK